MSKTSKIKLDEIVDGIVRMVLLLMVAMSAAGMLTGIYLVGVGYHAADLAVNVLWLSYYYDKPYFDELQDSFLTGGSIPVNVEYLYGMAVLYRGVEVAIISAFFFGYSLVALYGLSGRR